MTASFKRRNPMSSGSKQRPTSQLNLLLRIAAGAYLVYLTFDIRPGV